MPCSQKQRRQRKSAPLLPLRLLPLRCVVKSKGATVKSKGRHKGKRQAKAKEAREATFAFYYASKGKRRGNLCFWLCAAFAFAAAGVYTPAALPDGLETRGAYPLLLLLLCLIHWLHCPMG